MGRRTTIGSPPFSGPSTVRLMLPPCREDTGRPPRSGAPKRVRRARTRQTGELGTPISDESSTHPRGCRRCGSPSLWSGLTWDPPRAMKPAPAGVY